VSKPLESETFHNQRLTAGAAAREDRAGQAKLVKKVVALQLDEDEFAAFQALGGVKGLKAWLRRGAPGARRTEDGASSE